MNRQINEIGLPAEISIDEVFKIVSRYFNDDNGNIEYMPFGFINSVYQFSIGKSKYIFRGNSDLEAIQGTPFYNYLFKGLSIPVQDLIVIDYSKQVIPYYFQILTKIKGKDLKYCLINLSSAQLQNLAYDLIMINQKLEELPLGKGFGRVGYPPKWQFSNWIEFLKYELNENFKSCDYEEQIEELFMKTKKIINQYEPYLQRVIPKMFLIDATTKNIIVNNGYLEGIIDLDHVGYGDKLYSLGLTKAAILCDISNDLNYIDQWMKIAKLNNLEKTLVDIYCIINLIGFIGRPGNKKKDIIRFSNVSHQIIGEINMR